MDISNGLAGLSLLSGTTYTTAGTSGTKSAEAPLTVAQAAAKAQFTLKPTAAPWQARQPVTPSADAVLALKTIIDPPSDPSLPIDVRTDFTVYKALESLSALATAASAPGVAAGRRAALSASFQQGLTQLQTYMASAPSTALTLAFSQPSSTAKSIALPSLTPATGAAIVGTTVSSDRYAPLAGLSGSERFTITLAQGSQSDTLTIDLAQTAQPPTLDSVATAFTSAIAAIPLTALDGSPALDGDGAPIPRWGVSFVPTRTDGAWGLTIKRTGNETITLGDPDAQGTLNVSANITTPFAATATQVLQVPTAGDGAPPATIARIAATDAAATANAPTPTPPKSASKPAKPAEPKPVMAPTLNSGIAVDAQGNSYVLDTTAGTLGTLVPNGNASLALTKLDSQGKIVWQQNLGIAGASNGAAVTVAPNGQILVAATVAGDFNGAKSDGDMAVAAFNPNGTRVFETRVPSSGVEIAQALAVGQDGSVYVGGADGADGFVARLSASGALEQRASVAGRITALAIDQAGTVLALTQAGGDATLRRLDPAALATQLTAFGLGAAAAQTLAVAPDGTIAIGGSALGRVAGDQGNDPSGGKDGFVTLVGPDFANATTRYIGTAGNDQIDSLAFWNGTLFAAGTTNGALAGDLKGKTDGFLVALDPASGAVSPINQFGQAGSETGSVTLAASAGGDTALTALGLSSGTLTDARAKTLVANTALAVGDGFSIAVNGRSPIGFTIGATDTLATLSKRLALLTGGAATVTTPTTGTTQVLQIQTKPGAKVALIAGPEGRDALAKLGLAPTTLSVPRARSKSQPAVTPGGRYGLGLRPTLDLSSAADAGVAAAALQQALSITQTGYRSLYWDSLKAALVSTAANGGKSDSKAVAAAQGQLANYQAALTRLTAGSGSTTKTLGSGDPVTTLNGAMATMLAASLAAAASAKNGATSTTSSTDSGSAMLSAIYG